MRLCRVGEEGCSVKGRKGGRCRGGRVGGTWSREGCV